MLNFVFNDPTVVYFGRGQVSALERELRERAEKVLVVTGSGSVRKNGIFDQVMEEVTRSGCTHKELSGIVPNPRLESVYRGIEICRNEKIDFILAVGGGSVIDAAKAIAAGAKYKGDVWDFFERDKYPKKAIPLGAVLTLSATGSEMNTNSVITNEKTKRKLHMSSPLVRPVFSVLDPAYTFTVPKFHTAAGVADIMAHVLETYLAPIGNTEVMDRLSEAILKTCVRLGPVVCEDPYNYEARANIMWSSTLALNGMVSSGTASDWLCHGIEHEISAIYDISHGAGLAIILPAFIKVTSENYSLGKYAEYGANIWGITGGDTRKIADEAVERTRSFFRSLGLPTSLKESDITDEHFDRIVDNITSSRGDLGYYKQLGGKDIRRILDLSL